MSAGAERGLSVCRTPIGRLKARAQLLLCRRKVPWKTDPSVSPGVVLYDSGIPLADKKVCCFVHYDPLPRVDETVLLYLGAIARAGYAVVFVSTAPGLDSEAIDALMPFCAKVVTRSNSGLDFASWKCALDMFPELFSASSLVLANDSMYLTGTLETVFARMDAVSCDYWGMTESAERRRHLQSYFLVFRERALRSGAFRDFWAKVSALPDKKLVIRRYETALTLKLALAGLHGAAYIPAHWFPDQGKRNPSLAHGLWAIRELGMPLLKRQLLTENPCCCVDAASWADGVTPSVREAIQAHLHRLTGRTVLTSSAKAADRPVANVPPQSRPDNSRSRDLIDILLPTYNGQEFLPILLESVLGQRNISFQVLVRDDASTDNTMKILYAFAQRTGMVDVIQGEHRGVVKSIESLLQRSHAPYFAFADQDDYWYSHKLSACLNSMRELERRHGQDTPILVHSDARVVDWGGIELAPSFRRLLGLSPGRAVSFSQALVYACAQGCTMFGNAALRRQVTTLPDQNELFMHDWWVYLVARTHGVTYCLEQPLLDYRQHSGNLLGALARQQAISDRIRDLRENIEKTRRQAAALLSMHDAFMDKHMYEICHAWGTMDTHTFFERKALCVHYGFAKQGIRNIPFIILS